MSGGFALPRLRIRSRRRKPRGPEWKRTAAWCCFCLFNMAFAALLGAALTAIGWALAFSIEWRELHRWPCDPEATALSIREVLCHRAVSVLAVALMFIGIFS